MRRRDFAIGLALTAAVRAVRAQAPAKQHRIAIVIPAGPVAAISETSSDPIWRRLYQPFFDELLRLGHVEGQNLVVERYSGEGRREGFGDLAREIAGNDPELIVAVTNPVALAARAATDTIPIVWIGVEATGQGLVSSLAHPVGNITGVSLYDAEIYGKRLQILKEAVPSAAKIAFLDPRRAWEAASAEVFRRAYQEAAQRLQISLIPMLFEESTPSEYRRVFAEVAPDRPDAIMVSDIGDLIPYRQLIVELVEENRRSMAIMSTWRRAG